MSGFIWIFAGLIMLLIYYTPKIIRGIIVLFNPKTYKALDKENEFTRLKEWDWLISLRYGLIETAFPFIENGYSVKINLANSKKSFEQYGYHNRWYDENPKLRNEDTVFKVFIDEDDKDKNGIKLISSDDSGTVEGEVTIYDIYLYNPLTKQYDITYENYDHFCDLINPKYIRGRLKSLCLEASYEHGNGQGCGKGGIPNYNNPGEIEIKSVSEEERVKKEELKKYHEGRIISVLSEYEFFRGEYLENNPYASDNEIEKWYYFKLFKVTGEALVDGVCMNWAMKDYIYRDMPFETKITSYKGKQIRRTTRDRIRNGVVSCANGFWKTVDLISYGYVDPEDLNRYREISKNEEM